MDLNNDTTTESAPETPQSQPPTTPRNNKKLVYGILAGAAVLLIILMGLVIALLLLKSNSNTATTGNQSESSQTATPNGSGTTAKEIVKRVSTSDDKIELVIYKPRQTGSNTTIEFGLHNKCAGCEDSIYVSTYSLLGYSTTDKDDAYILDETAGKKYSLITDADDRPLATKSCSARITPDKTVDCFAAFTKVPSGTTVSIILGDTKIDGVRIQ